MKILLALIVFTGMAFAQFETAEVLGTVKDPTGGGVSKASVTLTNQETSIEAKATTDADGNYDFFNVKVGKYAVSVEAPGFSKATASDVTVAVGARQRVDMALQVGNVSTAIEVTGAASLLETDNSEHGQVIASQQIVELPLNGRNYSDLALLSTNVHRSPISVSFAVNGTPREGAFNVNGMRSTYNNFLLDGLDNNADSTSNQGYSNQVAQPSPDAIAEFKVVTNNYSAEYGRVGGAVVNAVLRSGTNQLHGTVYEFFRNTNLNAIGFTFSPSVFQKPPLHRNQFGATVGGPIVKNKLFFFGDYEGQRQLQKFLNFDSIPTTNDRIGILPVTVVNPLTGAIYPANTQIPASAITPFAQKVLRDLPATNTNGSSRGNNLQALLLVRDYYDKYDVKLDYQVSSKMTSFLRFSQRKDLQYYQPDIPGPSGGNGNGFIHAIAQNASVGYTWTVSPSSLIDARFAFNHIVAGKMPATIGGPNMFDLYGIPGLPTSTNLAGGLNSQTVSGFNQFGRQTSNPQFQNPTTFDPKFNYSWNTGRHALKFGYEFQAIRTGIVDTNPLYGANTYAGNFSKPTCAQLGQAAGCAIASDSTSYNLADFYFGTPSQIALGSNLVVNARQHINALYAQDDFHVTSKLTLNVGLRWEYATPLYERDNNYSNFDPVTVGMVRASAGDIFKRALVHPDYGDWGPRIGLAYSYDAKTVVRSGFGISYDFFNRPGSAEEGINAPQALFGVINQSIPAGGPAPAGFLTTVNAFTTNIASPAAFNPINSNVAYIPPDTKWPYVESWFLSIQREVAKNTILEVAYTGNHSSRLPIIADYNQAAPNLPGQTLGVQARRPIPSYGPITWLDPAGKNNYNGMSVRFEHRFSQGLYLLNSFTWSKALGDSEQALETLPGQSVANPQNIHNLAEEYGPSSYDVKLLNVTSVVYQLPFGKGRRFGAKINPVLDAAFGGWELNTINTANSGLPLNVNYAASAANDITGLANDYRGQAQQRPNVSGSAAGAASKNALVNNYFAGYTFTTPPANAPFGNLGRNAFRAPGLANWDLAVNKSFRMPREGMSLQFRSEFFNVLNHTNFGIPTVTSTSGAFGTIRSTYPPRQIQLALKLVF